MPLAPRRRRIPPHTQVFVAGEGNSEFGYLRWLNRLAAKTGVRIAFTAKCLQGGDPLELVESALNQLTVVERRGTQFRHRALLLDRDGLGDNNTRDQRAQALAKRHRVTLLWQVPCHEGFLLRHFVTGAGQRPTTARQAMQTLNTLWPGYRKGIDAIGYERILTVEHLATARAVDVAFDGFLANIGWR